VLNLCESRYRAEADVRRRRELRVVEPAARVRVRRPMVEALRELVLRLLAVVDVRRPPRRLVEVVPMFVLCLRDAPARLRPADFMRLVAITSPLSARKWVSSLSPRRGFFL
jgi:hypothetical protein